MLVTSGYCIHSQNEMTLPCNSNENALEVISDQDGGCRAKRVASLTVQNLEFNCTEFSPEHEFNGGKFKRAVGKIISSQCPKGNPPGNRLP